jgi:hypothetical protein
MSFKLFTRLASFGGVALGLVLYAGNANAVPVQSGDPTTVDINAEVFNTINVTTTTLDFGTIAALGKIADRATATVAPGAAVLTDDPGAGFADARIAADSGNPPATSQVTLVAVANTPLFIDYAFNTDLVEGGSGNTIRLSHIADNLLTPDTGVGGTSGNLDRAVFGPGPATNQGTATTDNTGTLVFHIGGSITTDNAADLVYANGAYTGQFDMTVSY